MIIIYGKIEKMITYFSKIMVELITIVMVIGMIIVYQNYIFINKNMNIPVNKFNLAFKNDSIDLTKIAEQMSNQTNNCVIAICKVSISKILLLDNEETLDDVNFSIKNILIKKDESNNYSVKIRTSHNDKINLIDIYNLKHLNVVKLIKQIFIKINFNESLIQKIFNLDDEYDLLLELLLYRNDEEIMDIFDVNFILKFKEKLESKKPKVFEYKQVSYCNPPFQIPHN